MRLLKELIHREPSDYYAAARVLYLNMPNREYNPLFDLHPGEFREEDRAAYFSRSD